MTSNHALLIEWGLLSVPLIILGAIAVSERTNGRIKEWSIKAVMVSGALVVPAWWGLYFILR